MKGSRRSEETYDLRCSKGDFLVVFLVLSLKRHSFNTLVDLGNGLLKLVDARTLAFRFDLAALVFLVELLFQLLGSL